MGFLEQYGVDTSEKIEPGRKLAPAGHHYFEIGDSVVKKGTKNKPKDVFQVIEYQLSDADGNPTGSVDERFTLLDGGVYNDRAKQSVGMLDMQLKRLGFEGGVDDPEFTADNLVGIRGKLEGVHNVSGDRVYANVRNVQVIEDDDADDNVYADNRTETAKAADKDAGADPDEQPAEEKPARRRAAAARAPRQSSAAENPWG